MTVIVDGKRLPAAGEVGPTVEITEIESLAKGTIIVGDGSGAPTVLAVGPVNQILQCDPSQPEGVSWTPDPRVDSLGIGTIFPNATLEVLGNPGASVGGFPSGALHVTSPSASVNANAVITGHNLFGGNKQLWYLGSTSGGNDAIALINRQNAALSLSTNSTTRLTVEAGGNVGIGVTNPTAKLEVNGFTKLGDDAAAPKIKLKKLTGTSPASEGGSTTIAHGLTLSKIIGLSVLITANNGNLIPPGLVTTPEFQYDEFLTSANVIIVLSATNSGSMLSNSIVALLTYEE